MKKLLIITGSSKGLGWSLAKKALEENYIVIGIARTKTIKNPFYFHLQLDLKKPLLMEKKLIDQFKKLPFKKFDSVTLVNNAGVVLPIDYFQKLDALQLNELVNINYLSPMILSSVCTNYFQKKSLSFCIVNLSSGAALRPIANWSAYCSSKSALKMFTDCISLEQSEHKNFKAISFSPGVMDTDMQANIRKQKPIKFSRVNDFVNLKKDNLLISAQWVSTVLFGIIDNHDVINKNFYDIKDFKIDEK